MDASAEDFGLCKDTNTADAVKLHFHVRVAVWITQVCQVWPPGGVFRIAFHNHGVFIKSIGERKCRFRFLPRVQVVRLFSAEPVRKGSPDICKG